MTFEQESILKRDFDSRCHSPLKFRMVNPYTRLEEEKEVPCGKCYHCRMTKINEWTTRLFAEATSSPYIYFVTLTYKGYKSYKLMPDMFKKTNNYVFKDFKDNYTHVREYAPLYLEKAHLQKYFKRLRKSGVTFRYFGVGEYGHRFARPHYHFICFSQKSISFAQFAKAWTLSNRVIGHVDVRPLSQNSDLHKSFNYVCKYMFKEQKLDELYTKDKFVELYNKFRYEYYLETFEIDENKIKKAFNKRYGTFMVCSKRPFIGSDYFSRQEARFKKGDFRLFELPKEASIFPTFFLRKIKERTLNFKSYSALSDAYTSENHVPFVAATLFQLSSHKMHIVNALPSFGETPCFGDIRGDYKVKFDACSGYMSNCEVPLNWFNFKDLDENALYIFDGTKYWIYDTKFKCLYDLRSIEEVLNKLLPFITQHATFLGQLEELSAYSKQLHNSRIKANFEDFNDYAIKFDSYISSKLAAKVEKQKKYLLTKTLF